MSLKRISIISIFCFIMFFGLTQAHNARAEEAPQPTIVPFTHINDAPVSVNLSGGETCYAIEAAEQIWIFELLVTNEMLSNLESALVSGGGAGIAFRTFTDIVIEGSGAVETAIRYEVILDDTSGSERVIDMQEEVKMATSSTKRTDTYISALDGVVVNHLDVGEQPMLLKVWVQVKVGLEGCGPDGQSAAVKVTKRVDKATPILYVYFPADNDLAPYIGK